MNLSAQIGDFYISNAQDLPVSKQFHLATRLAAWTKDPRATALLTKLRPEFVPEPYDEQVMRQTLDSLIHNPPKENMNAYGLRQEYFAKYPKLEGLHLAMFRVRHLLHVYNVDVRPIFFELAPLQECIRLEEQLLNDPQALRILSTYAVNYIYLLERVLLQHSQTSAIDIERFYNLGDEYDTTDRRHLQLLIYLYTHCIIGESNFYLRPIPDNLLPGYRKMLHRLEDLIDHNYDDINLDNKLEFLVCCRICKLDTHLTARIEDECNRSLSEDGVFLIDRHNNNQQLSKTSFAGSEHRNVLFILSSHPFSPLG